MNRSRVRDRINLSRPRISSSAERLFGLGCGIQIAYLAVLYTLSFVLFKEIIWVWFNKQLPWYADAIGAFLIPLNIPIGIISWIASFIFHTPFVHTS